MVFVGKWLNLTKDEYRYILEAVVILVCNHTLMVQNESASAHKGITTQQNKFSEQYYICEKAAVF